MEIIMYWILIGVLTISLSAYLDDWQRHAGLSDEQAIINSVLMGSLLGFLGVPILIMVLILKASGRGDISKRE
jgi:hypothetical protein